MFFTGMPQLASVVGIFDNRAIFLSLFIFWNIFYLSYLNKQISSFRMLSGSFLTTKGA